jgi:hypothetical protein
LPIAVFGVVVAAGALGAWIYVQPRMRASAPVAATSSPEQEVLAEAKKLCNDGDCETAHTRLDANIPESSRWRDTEEFREVESQWAQTVIDRADAVSDMTAKRDLYHRVAQTMGVDATHRKVAADRLQQLDANPTAPPTNAMELPSAVASAPSKPRDREDAGSYAMRTDAGRRPLLVAAEMATTAPLGPSIAAAPATTPTVGGGSANYEERERQLALQGTPDAKLTLKQQLEPRVYGGKASDAEVRLLISTCKDLGDKGCVQQARAVLAQRRP